MTHQLFHIYRNTPLGRETLLQSLYFCKQVGASPVIYIPRHTKFLMYFDNEVVQVDLDESYIKYPESAQDRAAALVADSNLEADFLKPKHFTASTLPDIPTNFDYMCCPRSITDLTTKIGLGHIGPRVRGIVKSAQFPVLLTSPVYKPWKSVAVFFGGSANALNALRLGIQISKTAGVPLRLYTQVENQTPEYYRQILSTENLESWIKDGFEDWIFFEKGPLEDNLFQVPHDALVILGAYGHGLIKDIVFGSKMEKIQSTISNNLLIAGPQFTAGR